MNKKRIILTGCAGFIGSNFVKAIACDEVQKENFEFLILDALTYAGRKQTIASELNNHSHLSFAHVDICDEASIMRLFSDFRPDGVIHFAAESHVDRSITNPNVFVETNVIGTLNLLRASLDVSLRGQKEMRFVHVSTDEVYGSLREDEPAFTEEHKICPNSPYSSSKAGSDLMVQAFHETYKMDTIITRCSNNYGPYQFPEKLIPLMISRALKNEPLPVYGSGRNIRDWIYVDDHNRGVWAAFNHGQAGQVYNFGGSSEYRNIDVVKSILSALKRPESLINFVEDRQGHDWRYAIDYSKAERELSWRPTVDFETGLARTIDWYTTNTDWLKMIDETSLEH